MPHARVTLRAQGFVRWLTLSQPATGNAIDRAVAREMQAHCAALQEDDEARVLVVAATGTDFCVGATPGELKDTRSPAEWEARLAGLRVAQAVADLRIPTIAAMQGRALGQGLELALACDLRIAAQGSTLGLPQVSQGYLPWDGATQRLPRLIGSGRAVELLYTGRSINADEALDMGLVHRVVPAESLEQAARELAERIAGYAPLAERYAKETVLKGLDGTLEQGLVLEADMAIQMHTSADRAEGIASFLQKRKPHFKGA